ncbi:spermatogenesis-associated protein 2-like protein [Elysia marginata]|uniref:Spermatogenesis-associated protein 2-like protein n=1 Tax=Elysia marginata TaxID=1093978 RepID=A0AAV4I5U7_9GAST|nr:spermatogenesis-associated protein 2-like protein [Elysia marginata]
MLKTDFKFTFTVMEALQQARLLYKQRYQQQGLAFLNDRHTHQLEAKIQRLIEIAIKEVPSVILFQTPDYLNVFDRALKSHSKATPDLATVAKAYESLEKYFLQLIEQPWKREFKRIKLYGGFYRTRIKSALPEPEFIFQQAGYSLQPDKQVLKLESPVLSENILMLAFDSRLCREQCQIIAEHYEIVKGLSVSLDQAINDILYSDRSRGRSEAFVPSACESSGLQVNLQPLSGEVSKSGILPSSGVPNIPKREPINRPSTMKYLPSEEEMGPVVDLLNRKMERQFNHFEGNEDEHIMQPYLPQVSTTSKNGHLGPEELDRYYQMQMLGKMDKNHLLVSEITPTSSALHNAPVSTPPEYYPRSTVAGIKNLSIIESYDEGIEKDFPPMSKSSRDTSARYPSMSLKSGLHQAGTATTKMPSSSLQPSMADQGYNTALGSNGHTTIPIQAGNTQVQQQSQQSFGSVIFADGVNTPPVGPPPIPPRALKPDYGAKSHVPMLHDVSGYSSSNFLRQPKAGSTLLPENALTKINSTTEAMDTKFQDSSVPTPSSVLPPMPSPKLSHSGLVMRRDRQHNFGGKSSSLKYNAGAPNGGTLSSSLLKPSQRSRGARSMDLTGLEWECHRCTAKNLSSDTVCSICSASRLKPTSIVCDTTPGSYGHSQPLDIDPMPGMSKKSCPVCTLENEPNRTHCSLCEAKLDNPYTYV